MVVALLLALTLPIVTGYLWLVAIERRFARRETSFAFQLGYGALLGWLMLYGSLRLTDALLGQLETGMVFSLLLALAVIGAGLLVRSRAQPAIPAMADSFSWLSALLLLWIVLHLALSAIDILHLPVYPWDAWLNWMYRAKAWFYAGAIVPFDPPAAWARGSGEQIYNVAGAHYPLFVPLMATWTTTVFGEWRDTVANLPTLLCGLVLAVASFGQVRLLGLSRTAAFIFCYALVSLPIIGAHLSLAGQADIWMAAYTGLGFVAVQLGVYRGDRLQLLLGLVLVGAGALIKLEGWLWFGSAWLMLAFCRWPQRVSATLAAVALLGLIAIVSGHAYLDMPGIGPIGIRDATLYLPLVGEHQLQYRDLADDYWYNFFSSGTWNLLWVLVVAGGIAALSLGAGVARRVCIAFLFCFIVVSAMVFLVTDAGRYADDWTAINRLPLHFAPALLFPLAITLKERAVTEMPQIVSACLAALVALTATAAIALVYLQLSQPTSTQGAALQKPAREFRPVAGGRVFRGDAAVVSRFDNSIAILSSGPLALDASQFDLAKISLGGSNRSEPAFFWRIGGPGGELHFAWLGGSGQRWIDLDSIDEWQGTISEIGFIFYADDNRAAELRSLELLPGTLSNQVRALWQNWLVPGYWTQSSVHHLHIGDPKSAIQFPVIVLVFLLICVVSLPLVTGSRGGMLNSFLCCSLLAWAVLDCHWTWSRIDRSHRTMADYPLFSATHLAVEGDRLTYELVYEMRDRLVVPPFRVLVASEDPSMRFEMLRAKYHAMPTSVLVHERELSRTPMRNSEAQQLLVLRRQRAELGYQPISADVTATAIGNRRQSAKVILDTPDGFLLELPDNARYRGEDDRP